MDQFHKLLRVFVRNSARTQNDGKTPKYYTMMTIFMCDYTLPTDAWRCQLACLCV